MPRSFLIDVPGHEERKDILARLLKEEVIDEDVDLDVLAGHTDGYSGSDLKELCRAALLYPVQVRDSCALHRERRLSSIRRG
jgi:SpoVK/Ycf46/Vps4 family AAA+-type ATPase